MEPTIVYKLGGPHRGPGGKTYTERGVSDEIELAKLLAQGYCHSLHEAVNPPEKKEQVYEIGLKDTKDVELEPSKVVNLDGEEITLGSLAELPKRGKGRPKKNKEVYGDDA